MINKKIENMPEPTIPELNMYRDLITDLTEEQLDEFTKEYFDLVQSEQTNVSFPRFLIDKLIRPVKPGDTISYMDEYSNNNFLYCLIRQDIEETTYLLFAMVDNETETIKEDQVYLFNVCGYDENGIEIIDIMGKNDETERILNIMESADDVEMVATNNQKEEK